MHDKTRSVFGSITVFGTTDLLLYLNSKNVTIPWVNVLHCDNKQTLECQSF